MTITELDKKLKEANDIILNWKKINGDLDDIHLAIFDAFEGIREAIIQYLTEKEG